MATSPHVEQRRALVADLYVTGLSVREIHRALSDRGWSVSRSTVGNDVKAVKKEWAQRRVESFDDWVSEQLATLEFAKRPVMRQVAQGNP